MKEHKIKQIIWTLGSLLLTISLFLGVPMITTDVIGANRTNETVVTKVWVWNTEPNITLVEISPSSISLNPGGTFRVNCTAYIWDYNGWQDINFTNATFYHAGTSKNHYEDDNNNHYTANSTACNCTDAGDADGTNITCLCVFDIWYYADNGTWICNVSAYDNGGNATTRIHNFNSTNYASATILEIIGINTVNEIDFGNLSVTETSNSIVANVTNWGNVPINVSIRGWGGSSENVTNAGNFDMLCDYGNISHGYERYSGNNISWDDMFNVSNTSIQLPHFWLPVRANDDFNTNDTNNTFWRIQIAPTIGGFCNGTVMFSAIDRTI